MKHRERYANLMSAIEALIETLFDGFRLLVIGVILLVFYLLIRLIA